MGLLLRTYELGVAFCTSPVPSFLWCMDVMCTENTRPIRIFWEAGFCSKEHSHEARTLNIRVSTVGNTLDG